MNKPKIYISGKISGLPLTEATMNFFVAKTKLLELGYDVVNPMSLPEHEAILKQTDLTESQRWVLHMKVDIKALMDCDEIYMMDNYTGSKGAMIERAIATDLNYKITYENDTPPNN